METSTHGDVLLDTHPKNEQNFYLDTFIHPPLEVIMENQPKNDTKKHDQKENANDAPMNRREAMRRISKALILSSSIAIPGLLLSKSFAAEDPAYSNYSNYCNYANYAEYANYANQKYGNYTAYGNYKNVASYANYQNKGSGRYLNYANYTNWADYINYKNYNDYTNYVNYTNYANYANKCK